LHDLIAIDAPLAGALTVADIDLTMRFAEAEKSPSTRRAYAFDWKHFEIWCLGRGACPLPAHQGLVAAYLSHLADQGRRASTIGRRAAAIGHRHKMAGHEPPTSSEGVRAVLRGIRPHDWQCQAGQEPGHCGGAGGHAEALPRYAHRQAG
jgi:hypothetical protein